MAAACRWAYRPRSASTITVHPVGVRDARGVTSASRDGRRAPWAVARTIFPATGIAHPRMTTWPEKTVNRWSGILRQRERAGIRGMEGRHPAQQERNTGRRRERAPLVAVPGSLLIGPIQGPVAQAPTSGRNRAIRDGCQHDQTHQETDVLCPYNAHTPECQAPRL